MKNVNQLDDQHQFIPSITVCANKKRNTGNSVLTLSKHKSYSFIIPANNGQSYVWQDADIPANPVEGWNPKPAQMLRARLIAPIGNLFSRFRPAPLFSLVGAIVDEHDSFPNAKPLHQFQIFPPDRTLVNLDAIKNTSSGFRLTQDLVRTNYTPPVSGWFYCYANDVAIAYDNNAGSFLLHVFQVNPS